MNVAYTLVALALTVALSACASTSVGPTSPSSIAGSTALSAEALAATWRVRSIQKTSEVEQQAPAGADYTITFADRLSARADCNTCSSAYSIAGNTLTIGAAVACTRAACPTMAFETAFESLLSGEHTVTTTSNSMTWVSSKGTIRLTR